MLPGPADLSKFPSIDPKILFAALGMPFKSVHSSTSARNRSSHAVSLASLLVGCCWSGILPSEKRQCLRWCSGRWCQVWQGGGVLFLSLKMSQNSIDDILFLDTGDDPDSAAAAVTDLDVDTEDSF